ncbi:MAG: lysophospholipid acyltransferase family protein, partial [Bacteroidales bacterium]|nr:lysophospholipid acyltransferase family protein [Bacteroidales bacterium]
MKLLYYIFILKVWILSLLPLRILYIFSDLLYFILYYIVKYRRKVVRTNLLNSFPNKSLSEIKELEKKFYKNLADIIIEVLKLKHLKEKELRQRFIYVNAEVMIPYFKAGKTIIAIPGHLGNWEWAATVSPLYFDYKVNMVYKPLTDENFEKYLLALRSKYALSFIAFKQTYRYLLKHKAEPSLNILASDQTPTKTEIEYWTYFMNQNTGFFKGAERIAKSLDCVVVFVDVKRIRRGYYE